MTGPFAKAAAWLAGLAARLKGVPAEPEAPTERQRRDPSVPHANSREIERRRRQQARHEQKGK